MPGYLLTFPSPSHVQIPLCQRGTFNIKATLWRERTVRKLLTCHTLWKRWLGLDKNQREKNAVWKNTGIIQVAELIPPRMRLGWWINPITPESCKLLCFCSPYPIPALLPQAKTFTAWLQRPVTSSLPHLLLNSLETHTSPTPLWESLHKTGKQLYHRYSAAHKCLNNIYAMCGIHISW